MSPPAKGSAAVAHQATPESAAQSRRAFDRATLRQAEHEALAAALDLVKALRRNPASPATRETQAGVALKAIGHLRDAAGRAAE